MYFNYYFEEIIINESMNFHFRDISKNQECIMHDNHHNKFNFHLTMNKHN